MHADGAEMHYTSVKFNYLPATFFYLHKSATKVCSSLSGSLNRKRREKEGLN